MAADAGFCKDSLLMDFAGLSRSLGADHLSFGNVRVNGFSSVSIDSRSVRENALFVAIAGTVNDGHTFVKEAFEKGAGSALVERKKIESFNLRLLAEKYGKTLIAVDNTLTSLQEAARVYLEKFPSLLKIGITGSSGKTTTKEIAAAIIGSEKSTVINPGNYNSETGLPLAVLNNVQSCHEVGIFEMGMNKRGEISALAGVLKPNIALVTNIGTAHYGILGSKDAIAEEKKEIFSRFDENCVALIPGDSDFRDFLATGVKGRVSFYGEKSFAEFGGAKSLGLDGSEILWNGERVRFALPGKHNLADALAAVAIAREIPVSNEAIKKGLESVKPLFGRGEIFRGRATVIRDCYNANPESLAAALDFCESLDWPGRRVYVIGEMLELGGNSVQAHEAAGRLLLASKADMVFLYGKECAAAARVMGAGRFFHTCDADELFRSLDAYVCSGDLILLKGSRGCALEKLTEIFVNDGESNGAARAGRRGSASEGGVCFTN